MARRRTPARAPTEPTTPPANSPATDQAATPGATNSDQRSGGLAAAFPGQGVDPGDLATVLRENQDDPLVRRLAQLLGTSNWSALDLDDTRIGQPSVFVGSVLSAQDLRHKVRMATVSVVFGHSLGELSAAAFAGVFDPSVGLDLVMRRAELGYGCNERRPGRMIVVMRLSAIDVEWVRRQIVAQGAGILELAVINGAGQFVLSGDVEATDAAVELIGELGGVGRRLAIGGAYHSPLMAPAVGPYFVALEAAIERGPRIPLVSSTTQAVITAAPPLIVALARALVLPVRWVETLDAVHHLGITNAVDAGPSQTLTNLARFSPILSFESLRPDPRRG